MALTHNKVQVSPDKQGNVIRVSTNNPEFAHVRVVQSKTTFGQNGWVNKKQLSALIHGRLEDLQELGFDTNSELPGNIIVTESFTPFDSKTPERHLKIAGDTGIVCKGVDQETGEVRDIYRNTVYDASGQLNDSPIPHVNSDEIKGALDKNSISQSELEKVMKKEEKKAKKQEVVEEPIEEAVEEEVEMEEESFEL